jgi:hypothetical protein
MNAHIQEALIEIAREAGATVPCEVCGNCHLRSYDPEADRMAYAMTTNAWKNGERGFNRGVTREEALAAMKRCLESANDQCPSCS